MCDTMLGIRCVGVCGCQSKNSFVCFGAKPTQRACARDLPLDRKNAGRKVREKTEEGIQQKAPEEDSQEMRVGLNGGQSTEFRKAAARNC